MYRMVIVLLIWIVVFSGIFILNRIDPDNHWYKIYSVILASLFTIFAVLFE
ncbi:hypothetical protein [Leuconostoc mesenteroides]|uniref:hypothetical protein n=1 Tax=Leuconostoc mesenteroides TaxID=1245 RepID=UPI001CBBEDE6|nr:hypothetical protein [Leuconostoc mesenteroides]MBZ1508897.1 hypothetical protein [Leuconostoc mesenteroides]MBZ1532815.1 hypothetical protein [Leuconostoc mesenteroides]